MLFKRTHWFTTQWALLGLFATTFFAGCTQMHDCKDETLTCVNNHCDAHLAWSSTAHCFADDPYVSDFRKGFKQGYIDAMNGGGECPPTLPPRCYWTTHNRTCDYPQKVASWYDGYMTGSTRAMSDGVQDYGRIITSLEIYGKTQCQSEFEWPTQDAQPLDHDLQLSPPPAPGSEPTPELPAIEGPGLMGLEE